MSMLGRPRSRRRRRDTPPPVQVIWRGALAAGALAVVLYFASQAVNGVPGRSYQTVYLTAPEVGSLIGHDPVRIAGVRVGQVLRRDVGPDHRVRVQLQIEPGVRLATDTNVQIRALGLLGARYVELIPGHSASTLADRAVLHVGAASYTSGLPEALEALDRPTRTGLQRTIDESARGVVGNGGAINDALRLAGPATPRFRQLADAVLARDGALRRLAPALRSAVRPLDENRVDLGRLTRAAPRALGPFVQERRAVQATLDRTSGTLLQMTSGLGAGRQLLTAVDELTASANRTLPSAPAGLRATTALLRHAPGPLQHALPLVKTAEGAVPDVLRTTAAASPLLQPLRHLVDTVRPILGQVVPKGCDVENFAATFRSMTGWSQPGRSGDSGPPEGFRAVAVTTLSAADLGLKDSTGLFRRDNYAPPCTWLSKPYLTLALDGRDR